MDYMIEPKNVINMDKLLIIVNQLMDNVDKYILIIVCIIVMDKFLRDK